MSTSRHVAPRVVPLAAIIQEAHRSPRELCWLLLLMVADWR